MALARRQHGMVGHDQLLSLGFTAKAIRHAVAAGGLHRLWPRVYAVGTPDVTFHGRLMGAVLTCGPDAVLSHRSAAALWEIMPPTAGPIDVSILARPLVRRRGIVVHRRVSVGRQDVTRHRCIPVTTPALTLIDVAPCLERPRLEAAINEADKCDLITPEQLRAAVDKHPGQPGTGILRAVLDRATFALTDSELERLFLPLAHRAGLPGLLTQQHVNGFRVDFFEPTLGLVIETDGLRYHRTAAQQARDRLRDQAHAATGLTTLRFTHAQVRYEPDHVVTTLAAVARRLRTSTND